MKNISKQLRRGFKAIVIALCVFLMTLTTTACQSKKDNSMMDLLLLFFLIQALTPKTETCSIQAAADSMVAADFDGLTFPMTTGPVKEGLFETPTGLQLLSYKDFDNGKYLVAGDMVYSEMVVPADEPIVDEEAFVRVVAPTAATKRWPNKQVNYQIASADATMVNKAIAHWEAHTAFRFTNSNSGDYLNFVKNTSGGGCWSYVGRSGGAQNINVDDGCGVGSTVHEIGHALGMEHEQTRIDRDEYVIYYSDRVQSANAHNYDKNSSTTHVDIGPYDFTSIMHYGSYYFASGSDPVMTKKDGSTISPNRSALTSCDINGINSLYANYSN